MPAENHTTLTPDTPVRYLKGVGPKTAERFEKLGIVTLADLLCHYPRRYIDFTKPYSIAEAPTDVECVVRAEVFAKPGGRILPGGGGWSASLPGTMCPVWRSHGSIIRMPPRSCSWGRNTIFKASLPAGCCAARWSTRRCAPPSRSRLLPLKRSTPQTEGLTSNAIAKCVRQLLPHAELLPDPLPPEMLAKYRLLSKADAVRAIHCPAHRRASLCRPGGG